MLLSYLPVVLLALDMKSFSSLYSFCRLWLPCSTSCKFSLSHDWIQAVLAGLFSTANWHPSTLQNQAKRSNSAVFVDTSDTSQSAYGQTRSLFFFCDNDNSLLLFFNLSCSAHQAIISNCATGLGTCHTLTTFSTPPFLFCLLFSRVVSFFFCSSKSCDCTKYDDVCPYSPKPVFVSW
jgi:hypothetical protein